MNQFIQRVAHYVANEVIIKGLANSKTFQKFAINTDAAFKEIHKTGTDKLNATLEDVLKKAAESAKATSNYNYEARYSAGPPPQPLRGIPGFVSAFIKEIQNDLGIRK